MTNSRSRIEAVEHRRESWTWFYDDGAPALDVKLPSGFQQALERIAPRDRPCKIRYRLYVEMERVE